jgi:hypothetical protein
VMWSSVAPPITALYNTGHRPGSAAVNAALSFAFYLLRTMVLPRNCNASKQRMTHNALAVPHPPPTDLGVGVLVELVGDDDVGGQHDLHALLLGGGHDLGGQLHILVLHQRLASAEALRLEEGEDHAAAQDDHVTLLQQGLDDCDLGGDLGAADDAAHGLGGVVHCALEVLELRTRAVVRAYHCMQGA